jgi:hypothetical protein
MRNQAGFGRALPDFGVLSEFPDVCNLLKKAVVDFRVAGTPLDNEALNTAYKRGWLHAELSGSGSSSHGKQPQYIFPSEVHRNYYKKILMPPGPFPKEDFPTLKDFWMVLIGKMSTKSLRGGESGTLASAGLQRPLEAQFQDELYRCSYACLGGSYLVSEWSGDKSHHLDFMVADMNWGIECLRDGDRLQGHLKRFEPGGSYEAWGLNDYVVLDFRTKAPRPNGKLLHPPLFRC